jgi:hypothetical protein
LRIRPYSTHGGDRNSYKILDDKPEGKRPLGRPRRRYEENIKLDHREIGREGVDWTGLGQDPATASCEHCNKPSGFIRAGHFLTK